MTTLSNTIALAVQAVLTATMPTSKTVATDHMAELLNDAIMPLLPVTDVASPEVLAAWSKACSAKNVLIDTFNPLLAHVPDSQLFSRTEGNNGELKESFDYSLQNIDISLDTVLRLATLLVQKHKRARPANMVESLHFAAEALEALELINNDATLAEDGEGSTKRAAAVVKDLTSYYNAVADALSNETGLTITREGILTARTTSANNQAVTQVWLSLDCLDNMGIESKLQRHYKADMRYCATMFKEGVLNGVNINDSYLINLATNVTE